MFLVIAQHNTRTSIGILIIVLVLSVIEAFIRFSSPSQVEPSTWMFFSSLQLFSLLILDLLWKHVGVESPLIHKSMWMFQPSQTWKHVDAFSPHSHGDPWVFLSPSSWKFVGAFRHLYQGSTVHGSFSITKPWKFLDVFSLLNHGSKCGSFKPS